jgi:hypothetical protein
MSTTTTTDAADALVTNRHGRAALGIAAANIRSGYAVIARITPGVLASVAAGLSAAAALVTGGIDQSSSVKASATSLLDRTNAYAVAVYGQLPDNDDPLDESIRPQILEALNEAESNLTLLESVQAGLAESFLEDLADLVNFIAAATIGATKWIADKAKQIVGAVVPTWVWYVLGGALVAGAVAYAVRLAPARGAA